MPGVVAMASRAWSCSAEDNRYVGGKGVNINELMGPVDGCLFQGWTLPGESGQSFPGHNNIMGYLFIRGSDETRQSRKKYINSEWLLIWTSVPDADHAWWHACLKIMFRLRKMRADKLGQHHLDAGV